MKNLYINFLALLVLVGTANAQQEQQYTQYMANPLTINPAVTGTEDYIDMKLGFRQQWVGFDAAPRTLYLTGHTTVGKEFNSAHGHHKGEHGYWHGVGGYIYSDETGPISRTSFFGNYAFNMAVAKKMRLSVGMSFGIKQFSFDPEGYYDGPIDAGDALIEGAYAETIPDLNLGFWLYNNDFYFGTSVYQVLNSEVSFDGIYEEAHNGTFTSFDSHTFVTGGVFLQASREVTIVPSIMVKFINPAPPSVDLNGKIVWDNKFWGGLSYRVGDAVAAIIGATLLKNHLDVSYSYDVTTSDIRKYSNGSHEVIVGYRFNHPSKLACPTNYWNKKRW